MRNKLYNRRLIFLTFCVIFFCVLSIGSVSAAEEPSANFTSNTTSGDAPLVVQFNDTSTGNATSWSWDFGDNGTSTEQNPVHTYTTEGTYDISLTASNEAGNDTIIQDDYITVAIPPTVTTNLAGGTYTTTQTVTLTTDDPTATIYYATDTTDPRTSDTRIQYTDSITISNTTTLRYAAIDTNGNWSQLYLQNYVIGTGTASRGQSDYTGPETNTTDWTYTTGGNINYSTPVTGSDGTIYIGSGDGILYALNSDGTLKWTYTTGNTIYGSVTIGSDGTIYVGSYDKNLYAISSDGTVLWEYDIEGGVMVASPVVGADGTIYIGSKDCTLYAINSDGTLKWSTTLYDSDPNAWIGGSVALASDGTIYVATMHTLCALWSDGTVKWSYYIGNHQYSTPSVGDDGTIYLGANGTFYAFNPDGTLKWSYSSGTVYGSASIASDGTIYIMVSNGTLVCF